MQRTNEHGAGRRRGHLVAVVAAAVLMVALTACNPLVNQPTVDAPGWSSTGSWSIDFDSVEGGWVEVQVIEAPEGANTIDVSGLAYYRETGHGCGPDFATEVAWSDGASQGYQRLAFLEPSGRFMVTFAGASSSVRFNVRVVDDAGEPVGNVVHHVPVPGTFGEVGFPIC